MLHHIFLYLYSVYVCVCVYGEWGSHVFGGTIKSGEEGST